MLTLQGHVLQSVESEPIPQVFVRRGMFTFDPPPAGRSAAQQETISGWVIPGLVDAHCHVGLGPKGPVTHEEAKAHATADRDGGTLLIRDAGSPLDTHWLDNIPTMPHIIRAGQHIAYSKKYFREFAQEVDDNELVAAVDLQLDRGDGWIKLVGDWIDRPTDTLAPVWDEVALQAAFARIHERGGKVTAHCFSQAALAPMINAGIDCIEHATGLTEETIALAAANDVAIVPTLINITTFPDIVATAKGKYPGYAATMQDLYDRRYDTIRMAHKAGIRIFAGTDAGSVIGHGRVVDELLELTKAGLTPAESLDAGCFAARSWLGRPGIQEGAPADALVLEEDPRQNLETLYRPIAIIRNGIVVKRQ